MIVKGAVSNGKTNPNETAPWMWKASHIKLDCHGGLSNYIVVKTIFHSFHIGSASPVVCAQLSSLISSEIALTIRKVLLLSVAKSNSLGFKFLPLFLKLSQTKHCVKTVSVVMHVAGSNQGGSSIE